MALPTINERTEFTNFSRQPEAPSVSLQILQCASTTDIVSLMTSSTFSTNYTMSNLPGTGRIMGNFYKSAGRRLERTMSKIAQRVGYGPEAIYERIRSLCRSDWSLNETTIYKLCNQLIDYTDTESEQNKWLAVHKLCDIFGSAMLCDLYGWYLLFGGTESETRLQHLGRVVLATPTSKLPQLHYEAVERLRAVLNLHNAGLMFVTAYRRNGLRLNGRRLVVKRMEGTSALERKAGKQWEAFQTLLACLKQHTFTNIALLYFDYGFQVKETAHLVLDTPLACDLCTALCSILTDSSTFNSVNSSVLSRFSKHVHSQLIDRLRYVKENSWGGERFQEQVPFGGGTISIPSVMGDLNDLAIAFKGRFTDHELELAHGLYCFQIKEKPASESGPAVVYQQLSDAFEALDLRLWFVQKRSIKTFIMELCNKLSVYARSASEEDKTLAIEKLTLFFFRHDVIPSIPSFGNAEWLAGMIELTSIICASSPSDLPASLRLISDRTRERLIDIIIYSCRGPLLWPKREWTLLHSVPGQFWEDPRDIYYFPSDFEKRKAWVNAFRTFLILLRRRESAARSLDCLWTWSNNLTETLIDPIIFSELCSTLKMVIADDALAKRLSMHLLGMFSKRIYEFLAGCVETGRDLQAGDTALDAHTESEVDICSIIESLKDIEDACKARLAATASPI